MNESQLFLTPWEIGVIIRKGLFSASCFFRLHAIELNYLQLRAFKNSIAKLCRVGESHPLQITGVSE